MCAHVYEYVGMCGDLLGCVEMWIYVGMCGYVWG